MSDEIPDDQSDAAQGSQVAGMQLTWERVSPRKVQLKAHLNDELYYSHSLDIHSATARQTFAKAAAKKAKVLYRVPFEPAVIEQELMRLATEVDLDAGEDEPAVPKYGSICDDPGRMGLYRETAFGQVALTNFDARIVREIVEDDGVDRRMHYEIEATLPGGTTRITVPASSYAAMDWVTELGARAVIHAGPSNRDHARAAIQLLSEEVPREVRYAHLGWRLHDGEPVYLHAGGAIGGEGPVAGVQVCLPAPFDRFELPAPASGKKLRKSVRASLGLLEVAHDVVTVPVFGSIWRAAIGAADFACALAGRTGVGKTELAALVQQHWGPALDARSLPASWSSTANTNEALAFTGKDAILVVDDFAPAGSQADIQRIHRDADRLIRGQGNSAGRGRMRPDSSLRPNKPPRGTILVTSEDVPRGASLRARLLVLEISPGMVDWDKLSACQGDAASGMYAQALAGYIRWLAPRYTQLRSDMKTRLDEFRKAATRGDAHKRTPTTVANLALGLELFTEFAVECGAISADLQKELKKRAWKALGEAAAAQKGLQQESDPVQRYVELLSAAIAGGKAHVASKAGKAPERAEGWGWRQRNGSWDASGTRVGWVEGSSLYLEPEAAFGVVQRMAQDVGEPISLGSKTLNKRLREQGKLLSVDTARKRLTVRTTLEGRQREVLHVEASILGTMP